MIKKVQARTIRDSASCFLLPHPTFLGPHTKASTSQSGLFAGHHPNPCIDTPSSRQVFALPLIPVHIADLPLLRPSPPIAFPQKIERGGGGASSSIGTSKVVPNIEMQDIPTSMHMHAARSQPANQPTRAFLPPPSPNQARFLRPTPATPTFVFARRVRLPKLGRSTRVRGMTPALLPLFSPCRGAATHVIPPPRSCPNPPTPPPIVLSDGLSPPADRGRLILTDLSVKIQALRSNQKVDC